MTELRPARALDAGAVGAILSGFVDETPWMPKLHSRAEDVAHASKLIARGGVTVALLDEKVIGFAALDGREVDALYIAASARGRGVGSTLMAQLKSNTPCLELWTFVANTPAQRFYQRHGFTEEERTDGARNDEALPDIRYRWVKEGARW